MNEFEVCLMDDDGVNSDRIAVKIANYGYHDAADRPVLSVNGERIEVSRLRAFCKRILELTSESPVEIKERF